LSEMNTRISGGEKVKGTAVARGPTRYIAKNSPSTEYFVICPIALEEKEKREKKCQLNWGEKCANTHKVEGSRFR